MPNVDGVEYPYTPEGTIAAEEARKSPTSGPELRLLDDLLFQISAEQGKGWQPEQPGLGSTATTLRESLGEQGLFPDKNSTAPVQRDNELLNVIFDLLTQQGVAKRSNPVTLYGLD